MRSMNLKYFFAGLAIAVPALLGAKPADPRVRTFINPDGSTVQVRVHGDEFFNFMTDAECTRLLETDSRGFLVDAVRYGETLRFNPDDVNILKAEVEEMRLEDMPAMSMQSRMAGLTAEGRSKYPTIGEGNHSLVVLVEFDDVEFSMEDPQDYFYRQLNEPGFSDYGGQGSALDYYAAISSGKYLPTFDVVGPVKLTKKASYFYKSREDPIVNMPTFVHDAMRLVEENCEVDFSNYDLDDDGVLDTVFFYYAGYGSADSQTKTIWPHQADYRWYSQMTLGGKKMGPYACANELKGWNPVTGKQPWLDGSTPWVDGIGTFTHEYGHVLGLPDLYDVNYTGTPDTPGDWDVMDAGCYNFEGCVPPLFSAYEQWVCNWLEFETAEDFTHYDLEALGHTQDPKAVRIRIPMNQDATSFYQEYFVIEARDNSGWDACFPEPGLMVWRINYKKNNWSGNSVNTNGVKNVEVIYAKNSKHPLFQEGGIYPGADVELKPSAKYSLWRSPYITDIEYDGESKTGSFDYNIVEPTDIATVLHDNPEADADGSKAFTLVWDDVEGVDEYLLTVKTSKSGKVVNGFEDTSVGKATSVHIDGLSTMYWKLEMQAFVTCAVGGIKSTQSSNIITFTPSELPKAGDSAVGSIEDAEEVISGGVGCINAPEGAEVYNPAGQRLTADGLAPGVYIVVYDNKSVKVMVR